MTLSIAYSPEDDKPVALPLLAPPDSPDLSDEDDELWGVYVDERLYFTDGILEEMGVDTKGVNAVIAFILTQYGYVPDEVWRFLIHKPALFYEVARIGMGEGVDEGILELLSREWKDADEKAWFMEKYPMLFAELGIGLPDEMDGMIRERYRDAVRVFEDEEGHTTDDRCAAIQDFTALVLAGALPKKERDKALQYILAGAEDEDAQVHEAAIQALTEFANASMLRRNERGKAAQCMLVGTEGEDWLVRNAAVQGLATLAAKEALEQEELREAIRRISKRMTDEEQAVRKTAISAIIQFAHPEVEGNERWEIVQCVLSGLKDGSWEIRSEAIPATAEIIERGIALTPKERVEVAQHILSLAGTWAHASEGVPVLARLFRAGILTEDEIDEAVQITFEKMDGSARQVRQAAILASAEFVKAGVLTGQKREKAVRHVFDMVTDREWQARQSAAPTLAGLIEAGALTEAERADAIQRIWMCAEDEKPDVHVGAIFAFTSLIEAGALSADERRKAMQYLFAGTEAARHEYETRRAAIAALASLVGAKTLTEDERNEAVRRILAGIKDKKKFVRKASISALSDLIRRGELTCDKREEAVRGILRRIDDVDEGVRKAAVSTIASLLKEGLLSELEVIAWMEQRS